MERERRLRGRVMIGGARVAVREREGELDWADSGRARPAGFRVWPKWAAGSFFLFFFFLFSFSFVSNFCFGFLKKLVNSDLNKNKADHFCSLKSVFKTHNLRVW
jgi:hypothetical protein